MRKSAAAALAAICMTTAAWADDVKVGTLEIGDAWMRPTIGNATLTAAYLEIENKGGEADRLVSAATPAARVVEIHTHTMAGDVVAMRKLDDGIEIPAGKEVDLEPGGLHLMIIDVTGPIAAGTSVPVTLTFEKAGSVELIVPVRDVAGQAHGEHMGHGDGHGGMEHGTGHK